MGTVIEVTQEDIDKGETRNPWTCPVAIAAKRVLNRVVTIGPGQMMFMDPDGPGGWFELRLPPEATAFINKYDVFRDGEPFSFTIPYDKVPSEAN